MSRILIEIADGKDAFSELREDWQRLFAVSGGVPFLSWEWLSVWFEFFGADRTPFILKIKCEGETIGILPLGSQNKKVFGMNLRRLGFLGEAQGGADYLDLIAKERDKAEILPAVLEFLKKESGFDVLCLENLARDSEIARFLKNQDKNNFRYQDSVGSICPQINLSGGWEKVLKESRRAGNFRRKLKKLEKTEDFGFRSVTSAAEIPEAFERFFVLHERRWAAHGGSELSGHPRLAAFQRDAVKKMAQAGLVRFDELWAEGKCRASVYGLTGNNTFYYYNSGYDLDWSNQSVGLVLIGLSVKNAIERGDLLYDFLRGEENYKFDWANTQNELLTVNLSRKNIPATAYEAINRTSLRIRDFSKNILPEELTERVKTWKRIWERNRQFKEKAEVRA